MNNVNRFEDKTSRLLRGASASSAMTFGTSSPYGEAGKVGHDEVGFAHIMAVGFRITVKDPQSFVPTARQIILRAVEEARCEVSACQLMVHVNQSSRQRMFTDRNPASESHGKNKRGVDTFFWLEVDRRQAFNSMRELMPRTLLTR